MQLLDQIIKQLLNRPSIKVNLIIHLSGWIKIKLPLLIFLTIPSFPFAILHNYFSTIIFTVFSQQFPHLFAQ